MKDRLIKLINETIDRAAEDRIRANKIMEDDYAKSSNHILAYKYMNCKHEDDSLSKMMKNRLNSAIRSFDLEPNAKERELDYKKMWEELKNSIACRMNNHTSLKIRSANRNEYNTAHNYVLRCDELYNILSMVNDIEEEEWFKK